jgi:hypothetical protein
MEAAEYSEPSQQKEMANQAERAQLPRTRTRKLLRRAEVFLLEVHLAISF